jgi:hypothetical protein
MAFWYSLWSFGIFLRFGMFGLRKIWQPWAAPFPWFPELHVNSRVAGNWTTY